MPNDIQDFIGTFVQLKQLQNQTQQVAEQARNDTLQGVNMFMQLARQTAHPGELSALTQRFSELGIGTPDQLSSLLTNVTPTEDAIRAAQTQFGINIAAGDQSGTEASRNLAQDTASAALTGQNRGQRAVAGRQEAAINAQPGTGTPFGDYLNRAFATKVLADLTPGGATIDALLQGLPTPELTQAAGVRAGTRLSAGDNAQLQTQQANNRLGWAQLADMSAYHAGELGIEESRLRLSLKNAKEKGIDPGDIVAAINAKTAIIKTAQDAKNKNPTPAELRGIVGSINAINAHMKELGLPYEPPIREGEDALKSDFDAWWDKVKPWHR